jgi:hypothetical protein
MDHAVAAVGVSWGVVFLVGLLASLVGAVLTPAIRFVLGLIRPLVVPAGAPPRRSYRLALWISLVNSFLTCFAFFILGVLVTLWTTQTR